MPFDTLLLSFTTFFATIGPADLVLVYAGITDKYNQAERRRMAMRAAFTATIILVFFALFGSRMLSLFGITLPALRMAGGILLLLISIDMVFARHSGGTGTTPEEEHEARARNDIAIFPLATPLIAGPGAISAVVLLFSETGGFNATWFVTLLGLLAVLALCYLAMLASTPIQKLLGLTGLAVVSRVVGVLLAALSVQFILDGLRTSGLFVPA
jgi:multiple antibiotic resistance protein